MLSYLGLEMAKEKQSSGTLCCEGTEELHIPEMSCSLVQRIIKVHKAPKKSHRNIRDQEKKFLDYIVAWMKRCTNDAQETTE